DPRHVGPDRHQPGLDASAQLGACEPAAPVDVVCPDIQGDEPDPVRLDEADRRRQLASGGVVAASADQPRCGGLAGLPDIREPGESTALNRQPYGVPPFATKRMFD